MFTVSVLSNLTKKTTWLFFYSSGVLLLMTAIAKLISSFGSSPILALPDPIFIIPFRWVFCIAGIVELAIAYVCFFDQRIGLKVGLVTWLATSFVAYRLGLMWLGYRKPCHCLGDVTDALHISPQTADTAMKIVLGYLLIGSYANLLWLWRQRKNAIPATASG
jgi:hypothetical protein